MFKKTLPSPLVILLLITVAAAVATRLLPAGQYNSLSYENNTFIIHESGGDIHLPFSQKTLDSLHLLIPAGKFKNGNIRKPVSIPGTYHRLPQNAQGPAVNAYLYGMGIMGFMTPTGLLLPSLALVNVSYKAWLKFIYPLVIMLFALCAIFLIVGIKL